MQLQLVRNLVFILHGKIVATSKRSKNAKLKKFNNEEEANRFLTTNNEINKKDIVPDYYVYTDSACSKNGAKDAIAGIGIFLVKTIYEIFLKN